MKKNFLMLAAAAFMFAACGDLVEIPDVTPGEQNEPQPEEEYNLSGDVVMSATVADLLDGTSQTWAVNDEIVFSDGSKTQTSKSTKDGQIGKFPVNITAGSTQFVAYYPAASSVKIEGTTVKANIPVEQTDGAVVAPRVAKSSSSVLFFNNLVAKVGVVVDMDGVTEIKLVASTPVAGDITVDFSGSKPVVSATANTVVLKGNFEKGKTYYFTLVEAVVENCTLELSAGSSVIAHAAAQNVEFAAGQVLSVGTVIEDVPTYKVTNMWVYGGTGPEYGGGKVYDLLTKEDFFNNEDGRGIAAIKDNYFELRHNGEFCNWAGEDGRNWWMVYSGAHNPTNGKDVDIRPLYDMIPLSEATYAIDAEGKITFTMPDGRTSVGQVVPAGEYTVSSYNHKITVNGTGIMFQFQGGKDDWNNMYNEWNAIACRPRVMVIDLEAMPVDFHAPEAARTVDADFEYVAPLEPDQKFDFEAWPGSWNVRGGNSSPYGIWVLGGTGDDPAFISPIDKSWDWTDSIWWESDNGLVINVSSKTATEIKGTTNYWAGADGKFWDYTWKGTSEDLSKFYGQLPHGEYEFTLNLETFVITFGNGAKANLLGPGDYEFIHGKTLSIPDGMFAFDFELGTDEMETPTSSRWTDIDRFVYGPRNYVMIFEKE